jgi:hypothetical protein
LPGSEEESGEVGQGGEMTQTIHSLNNRKKKENLYCQKKKNNKKMLIQMKKRKKNTPENIF